MELTLTSLFVTIAFVIIDANFSHLVPSALLTRMREAMCVAVKGDEERVGGINGDNMRPCYTNVGGRANVVHLSAADFRSPGCYAPFAQPMLVQYRAMMIWSDGRM